MNPSCPKLVPQLFLMIQQVGVQPTICTAWFICALGEQLNTPNAYFSHPVALTAATTGPSCSISIIVLSSILYFETLLLFEIVRRSLVEHTPQSLEQGWQGNARQKGSPLFNALSIAFSRYPPEQLLPIVHFRRYCSERSTRQISVFIALPCSISELQHIATVAKDQQVPHVPCALAGVTAPLSLQSSELGAPSFNRTSESVLVIIDSSQLYFFCQSRSSLQFYGRNRDLPSAQSKIYVRFISELKRSTW